MPKALQSYSAKNRPNKQKKPDIIGLEDRKGIVNEQS